MKIIIRVFVTAFLLLFAKILFSQNISRPKRIIFETRFVNDSLSKQAIKNLGDTLTSKFIKEFAFEGAKDQENRKLAIETMMPMFMDSLFHKLDVSKKIILDINQDTIVRYKKINDEISGGFVLIIPKTGEIFHRSSDSSFLRPPDTKLETNYQRELKLTEDKSDTKTILGYNCYKIMVIEKTEKENSPLPMDLGDIIYEMYVSESISIPALSILYFPLNSLNVFPLEIVKWNRNLKDIKELTKAVLIE